MDLGFLLYSPTILDGLFFDDLSKILGLSSNQIKLILCLYLAFPLGILHRNLSSETARNIFSLVVGLCFSLVSFGYYAWVHIFISSTAAYFLLKSLPVGLSHKVAVGFTLTHLIVVHFIRFFANLHDFDAGIAQMVFTAKITSFAFSYKDGQVSKDRLREEWIPTAIKKLPNLLEFYAFCFCFTDLLVGPVVEFNYFHEFNSRSQFKDTKGALPPGSIMWSIRKFFEGHCSMVVFLLIDSHYPASFVSTPTFKESSLLLKYGYLALIVFAQRNSYYFIWRLAEGGCISSGLGYNGQAKDGTHLWNGIDNFNARGVELADSPRTIVLHWNVRVATWLKNYVYLRPGDPKKKTTSNAAMYLTNIMSAVWHGIYPRYYVSFFTLSLLVDVGRRIRRRVRPLMMKSETEGIFPLKQLYDIGGMVITNVALAYLTFPFFTSTNEAIMECLYEMKFSGHIILFALLVIFTTMDLLEKPSKKKTN